MARSNSVVVKGDITSDIYYDIFTQNGKSVPFLRVYLMVNGTPEAKEVKGLRVVFYGYLAELAEAHLKKGSRILVEGHIQMRKAPNGNLTFEVVAEDVEFLRNITWERGQKKLEVLAASGRSQPEKTAFTVLLPDLENELPGQDA
jgi:single-stranded DNA-binding protein